MGKTIRRGRRRKPRRAPLLLSAREQAAWEECLGVQSDTLSAWGHVVGTHLFRQPKARRLAHLTHALRVLPFVPKTPEGRFILVQMSEAEFRDRIARLDRPDVGGAIGTLKNSQGSAQVMAKKLLGVLTPLDARDRSVVLGIVLRKFSLAPAELPKPRKTSKLTADDHTAIVAAEREAARSIIGALRHWGCDHTTRDDVAAQVLAALDAIDDPVRRKVMLAFTIEQLVNASRPNDLGEALARMLGGVPGNGTTVAVPSIGPSRRASA